MIDAHVERAKFAAEVAALERYAPFRARRCSIARVEFPFVDVVFTSRWPPMLALVAPGTAKIMKRPLPGATPYVFGARIDFSGFDVLPLSVSFREASTWEPLLPGAVGGFFCPPDGPPTPVVHAHPKTGLPFLCVPGVREYHEQPIHEGDDWLLYRGEYGLPYVVDAIWETCAVHARPLLLQSANGPQTLYEPVRA